MIYGYIRVSSDKQTVENQRFEISNFCKYTCKVFIVTTFMSNKINTHAMSICFTVMSRSFFIQLA